MLPGMSPTGGGFSGSSSAQSNAANELNSSHVFNFGGAETSTDKLIKYSAIAAVLIVGLFVFKGR